MNWSEHWKNRYLALRNWIRPYLGGQIRLDEIDPFCIYAFIDVKKQNKDSFIVINHEYAFHKPSGYLVHLFAKYGFKFTKDKFGFKIITRINRIEPGRRVVYAERIIRGPRGGKLFALGSATHITTNEHIIANPKTRKILKELKLKLSRNPLIVYPHIYEAERKFWYKPFKKYFLEYAIKNLWPS